MDDGAKPRDLEAKNTATSRDALAAEARELTLIFASIISKSR